MNRLSLEIITPEKVMVRQEVDMVEAPGASGAFGILPGHVTFLTTLECGEVRFFNDTVMRILATSGGYAEVTDDKVLLLLDTAEFAEDIDLSRAQNAMSRAESNLKQLSSEDRDYALVEGALQRAVARISAASKSPD